MESNSATPSQVTPDSTSGTVTIHRLWYWLAAAFMLRLLILNMPYMFTLDVNTFRSWGETLFKVNPTHFYDNTWSDYPPFFMYLLWVWNWVAHTFTHQSMMSPQWIKFPSCVVDIVNAYLIFILLKGRVALRSAYRSAIFYAFNPVIIFVSAVWGQVDALTTLMALLLTLVVLQNRFITSAVVASAAILIKPQGLFMVPVAWFALWHRQFDMQPEAKMNGIAKGLARNALAIAIGSLTAYLLIVPAVWHKLDNGVTPVAGLFDCPRWLAEPYFWLYGQMLKTSGTYPYSSVNAFNLWMLPPPNEAWQPDSRLLIGLSHQTWGFVLVGVVMALVGIHLYRQRHAPQGYPLFLAAAVMLTGFYMVATRMHERYIFPAIAFLALAAACNRQIAWIYWTISTTSFLSIAYIFYFYNDQSTWVEALKGLMNNGQMVGSLKLSGAVMLSLVNVYAFFELLLFLSPKSEVSQVLNESAFVRHWRTLTAAVKVSLVGKIDFVIAGVLGCIFIAVALYRLGIPNEQIFDEVYHARTAMEYIKGVPPYEWTHPPLSKLIAALGILGLGGGFDLAAKTWTEHMAFSWRFTSVIFGGLSILVVYALARSMFKNTAIATIAAGLLMVDGVFFVQSRVAMTNVYEVFFIMLSAYGTWRYLETDRSRYLSITALAIGCALACRWASLYAWGLTGLLLLWHAWRVKLPQWYSPPSDTESGWRNLGSMFNALDKQKTLQWAGMIVISMFVVPAGIYGLSYVPYVLQGDGTVTDKLLSWNWQQRGWGRVLSWQTEMWNYHAHLQATHPYNSPWFTWPLMFRPTWYYFHDFKGEGGLQGIAGVWAIGNAAIWWASIPALAYVGYLAWRDRLKNLGMVAVLGLGLWLMWGVQPRPLLYMHYMLETIPFACIAIAYIVYICWYGDSSVSRPHTPDTVAPAGQLIRWMYSYGARRTFVILYGIAVALWFIFYYPLLSAWCISWPYYNWHVWFGRAWI
jgi:Gpi18-like mannosyltransferase